MVYELMQEAGYKISNIEAKMIIASMMIDTVSFRSGKTVEKEVIEAKKLAEQYGINYEELEKTIDKTLSKFEKQVLNRFLKGESYVAIAQKLDSPVKSVDNAIQRIRKKAMKNIYKDFNKQIPE